MTTDVIRTFILAESDRRDRELQTSLDAWRQGWDACTAALDDAYEAGFADGLTALKHAQHQAVTLTRGEQERWGPGGREHYGDPRPGDHQGGPVTW